MPDQLQPQSLLPYQSERLPDGTALIPIPGHSLFSVATASPPSASIQEWCRANFGAEMPVPGQSVQREAARALRLSPDSLLVQLPVEDTEDQARLTSALPPEAYWTDQSDAWCTVSLKGPSARRVLALLTYIDTSDIAFTTGAFARTSMEHLNVILIRENDSEFMLMSPSSLAGSFWHAAQQAFSTTLPEL